MVYILQHKQQYILSCAAKQGENATGAKLHSEQHRAAAQTSQLCFLLHNSMGLFPFHCHGAFTLKDE